MNVIHIVVRLSTVEIQVRQFIYDECFQFLTYFKLFVNPIVFTDHLYCEHDVLLDHCSFIATSE